MKRISYKGVIIGGVLDIVLSTLAVFPIAIYGAVRLETWKLPSAQQAPALMQAMTNDRHFLVIGMVTGSLCSVIGGYVAARIARREAILNGALSAWLCTLFGAYAMVARQGPLPLWVHALFLLLSPAIGAVGGYLSSWPRRRTTDERSTEVLSVP